jgi:hypothetical protein
VSGLPKVCQLGKYTIFFWSRENGEPIHVHVCEGVPHAEATKIWMNGMVRLAHNKSQIPGKDLNIIMRWLAANRQMIEAKWDKHFGDK